MYYFIQKLQTLQRGKVGIMKKKSVYSVWIYTSEIGNLRIKLGIRVQNILVFGII